MKSSRAVSGFDTLIDDADPGGAPADADGIWTSKVAPARDDTVDPHRQAQLNRRLLALLLVARVTMTVTGVAALVGMWSAPWAEFPWWQVVFVLTAVTLLSVALSRQLRQHSTAGENLFMLHLLGDVALLTFAFFHTGGVDNPFLIFYVLPLTLAAYSLQLQRLAIVAATVAAAMVLLYHHHVDLQPFDELVHEISHLVAIGVITYFAYAVARLTRRHDHKVALARETALQERGSQAMGTVAARAADSISSPLATMAVLVQELQRGALGDDERRAALATLTRQIQVCKTNLSELLSSVGHPRGQSSTPMPLAALLYEAARECELMDPGLRVRIDGLTPQLPQVVAQRSLREAFVMLMQHAARHEPRLAQVKVEPRGDTIAVQFCGAAPYGGNPRGTQQREAERRAGAAVSAVAALVQQLGGTLVRSPTGELACLQLQIPIAYPGIDGSTERPPDPPGPPRR